MAVESNQGITKRPVGVWVITCFYFLSLMILIPSMIFVFNNHPDTFSQFTSFEIAVSFLTVLINLFAVILLFMLRALSFWIFLGAIIVSSIPLIVRLLSGQDIPMPENSGVGTKFFEVLIWSAMLLYVWSLKTRGILK